MAADAVQNVRHVIGTMTGTSIDGIDVALVRVTGRGMAMKAKLIAHAPRPLGDIGDVLRHFASGQPMTAETIARTAWSFGELHAEVIGLLLREQGRTDPPDLIAVHGQTVFHRPPISYQLINPAPIARRLNAPVIFDLRQADLAAGGQGAPITPIADWIMFRDAAKRRATVNLGGFCNATLLPAADQPDAVNHIDGFDLCACNQLLDAIAREALDLPYDDGGKMAASGKVDDDAATELLSMLQASRDTRRSLGTGDECFAWMQRHIKRIHGPDLAATAVAAIARCISDRHSQCRVDEIILAGGGTRNGALTRAIADHCAAPVSLSDAHGIPAEAREAVGMAILGALSADGVPITLPHITGCRAPAPIAGVWAALQQRLSLQ